MINEHGQSMVLIKVDGKGINIHRGNRSVSEIKTAGSVPYTYDLEELVEGKLVPLADDGSVTIKGGEIFISHVKDSASS